MRLTLVALTLLPLYACSSSKPIDGDDATTGADGSVSDAPVSGNDASTTPDGCGPVADAGGAPEGGPDCVGLGPSCDPKCGLKYGYLCTGTPPSEATGCQLDKASGLGASYCCATLACVKVPKNDSHCASSPGKPHLYQCYQDKDGGEVATPKAGCVEIQDVTLTSALSKAFCCP